MAIKGLSTPLLVINNVTVAYLPNTLSFTEGIPEKKLRAQTAGGGSVQMVYTTNVETQFSNVKFSLTTTADHIQAIKDWENHDFDNAISLTDAGLTRYGSNAGIINKPDISTGVDGKIDIEFQCDPLV